MDRIIVVERAIKNNLGVSISRLGEGRRRFREGIHRVGNRRFPSRRGTVNSKQQAGEAVNKNFLLQFFLTMVKHEDAIYLEPAPEDLLSVWGKEVTAQNLARFFGGLAEAVPAEEDAWTFKGLPEYLGGKADVDVSATKGRKEHSHPLHLEKSPLQVSVGIHGNKLKPLSGPPRFSGGLEDIVNISSKQGIWVSEGAGLKVGNVITEQGNRHTLRRSPVKTPHLNQNNHGLSPEGIKALRFEKFGKSPSNKKDIGCPDQGFVEQETLNETLQGSRGVKSFQAPAENRDCPSGNQVCINNNIPGGPADKGQEKSESNRKKKEFSLKKRNF